MMSIGTDIAKAAEGVVAGAAESAVSSVASSVVGGAVSAATASINPLSYIKWAGYALGAAAAMFLAYKVIAYVEQAQADHAAVSTLTVQLQQAAQINADNVKADAAKEAQHNAVVASATAAKAKVEADNADLKAAIKGLRDEQSTPRPACVPTAGERSVLDGLRKPNAAGAHGASAAKSGRVGG